MEGCNRHFVCYKENKDFLNPLEHSGIYEMYVTYAL